MDTNKGSAGPAAVKSIKSEHRPQRLPRSVAHGHVSALRVPVPELAEPQAVLPHLHEIARRQAADQARLLQILHRARGYVA